MEEYLTSPYEMTPPLALIVKNKDGVESPLLDMTGTKRRVTSWVFVADTPERQADLLAAVRQVFRGLRPEQIGVKTFASLRTLRAYVAAQLGDLGELNPAGATLRYECTSDGSGRGIAMPWRHLVERHAPR
jgi:hypothetical protein